MSLMSQRLVFVARGFFRVYKIIESSEKKASKVRRIVSNSGCLVAGCCFSRQSKEDSFYTSRKNYVKLDSNIKSNDYVLCNSSTDDNWESRSMKRSSEIIDKSVSEDSKRHDTTDQTPEKHNKKRKISDGEAESEIKPSNSSNDTSCTISEPTREEKREFPKAEKKQPQKKLRPNYFVAVKVSDQEIHKKLKEIQDHISMKERNLRDSMAKLKTLHITLMVMHIGDAETHARAMTALRSVHQEYDQEISNNPIKLEFKGLDHFNNRVLYAKLSADQSYERFCSLAEGVKKHFAANEIISTDKRAFSPHLTVAKIDFSKKYNRVMKRIDPELYEDYVDQSFGSQTIESIQLLSMTNPKNEEGYYCGDEIYFSAFDPCKRRNDLCELLEIEEKKKRIKEVINSLMTSKLK